MMIDEDDWEDVDLAAPINCRCDIGTFEDALKLLGDGVEFEITYYPELSSQEIDKLRQWKQDHPNL